MAAWFTDNLNEQASIWCFFSIAQIAVMFIGVLCMGDDKGERATSSKTKTK